jgi:hypothetical protein
MSKMGRRTFLCLSGSATGATLLLGCSRPARLPMPRSTPLAPALPTSAGSITGNARPGPIGAGRFTINAFHILENLGQHPAAGRLMWNLISHEATLARGLAAPLPADWQGRLTAIDYVPQYVSAASRPERRPVIHCDRAHARSLPFRA